MFGLFKKKSNPEPLDQARIIQLGAQADHLNAQGAYAEAIAQYQLVISTMRQAGVAETYFLGKAVLGILLALVRAGQIEEAHRVWVSHTDSKDDYGLGVYSLEHAGQQFDAQDICLYYLICAYIHAYAGGETSENAVVEFLNLVSTYAVEDNRDFKSIVSHHWFIDTLILCQFQTPNRFSGALESMYQRLGRPDEALIMSLVNEEDGSTTFNQKSLSQYFPNQAAWESGEAAVVFHPDGSVKVG